jgi:glycosidase
MNTEWFDKAIIYQILIDRFSGATTTKNRPDFLGGNIKGISKKLDYLMELGINVIWLSPFCKTDEYHGYHITDYEVVDPHFGTTDDLKDLIKKAHEKSIKIIADFVPNHCSYKHPFFLDARNRRQSKYYDWFYFTKWPDDYLCFLKVKELPKLNLENTETRDYFVMTAKYWLSLGLDGYRIDHVIGPSHKFWKHFHNEIKSSFPACLLLGEAWGEGVLSEYFKTINIRNRYIRRVTGVSQESLQLEYYGELDGIIDFKLNELIIKAVSRGTGFTSDRYFRSEVSTHFNRYPNDYHLITFLDNHDMNRFLYHCKGDFNLFLEAIEFLLSTGRPVVIYYGTETGMVNKKPVITNQSFSDLLVREPLDWDKIDYRLYERVKQLISKYRAE